MQPESGQWDNEKKCQRQTDRQTQNKSKPSRFHLFKNPKQKQTTPPTEGASQIPPTKPFNGHSIKQTSSCPLPFPVTVEWPSHWSQQSFPGASSCRVGFFAWPSSPNCEPCLMVPYTRHIHFLLVLLTQFYATPWPDRQSLAGHPPGTANISSLRHICK